MMNLPSQSRGPAIAPPPQMDAEKPVRSRKALFKGLAWMFATGALLGLSAPGYNWWILAWLALIPALAWVRRQDNLKDIFWGGFCQGFAYHGVFCLWFFDLHPLSWLGFTEAGSRIVTLLGWMLIAAEGGLLGGMLMVAYKSMRWDWIRMLVFPFLWVFGFSMLNWTPMALPWALLEYTQAPLWGMRAVAAIVGGAGVAALVVFHNVIYEIELSESRTGHFWFWKYLAPLLLPLILLGLERLPAPVHGTLPLPVAVIQANLPIEVIRSAHLNRPLIDQSYIQPALNTKLPSDTLLVFPEEGIVPGWVPLEDPLQNPMLRRVVALAERKHIHIAVGVSSFDPQNRQYNSIAMIPPEPGPIQFYHKRRLVPFGEHTPYNMGHSLTSFLATMNVDYSAPYTPGQEAPLLRAGAARLGGLVCFELIDAMPILGGYAQGYQRDNADMLINTSNLGWFHQNPLLEAQFLAIGQMRAAETDLPLVIASNSGISAIIAPMGRILRQAEPLKLDSSNSPHKTQVLFYNGGKLKNSFK